MQDVISPFICSYSYSYLTPIIHLNRFYLFRAIHDAYGTFNRSDKLLTLFDSSVSISTSQIFVSTCLRTTTVTVECPVYSF